MGGVPGSPFSTGLASWSITHQVEFFLEKYLRKDVWIQQAQQILMKYYKLSIE